MMDARNLERFWSKVAKGDDASACWLWTPAFESDGYGVFKFRWGTRTLGLLTR